jgi:hypothetical protein
MKVEIKGFVSYFPAPYKDAYSMSPSKRLVSFGITTEGKKKLTGFKNCQLSLI